jgi:hypothetical protein
LKPSQTKKILSLYHRRVPPQRVITPELARTLTEISLETNRQLAVLIDRGNNPLRRRRGPISSDPRPFDPPGQQAALAGCGCPHTPRGELSHDDHTGIALLRLDFIAAAEVWNPASREFLANTDPLNESGGTGTARTPCAGALDVNARRPSRRWKKSLKVRRAEPATAEPLDPGPCFLGPRCSFKIH